MTANEILKYCQRTFDGLVQTESWGERGIFYNPDGVFKRGVYVLTVKDQDSENDRASHLDREGVFRVNFGLRQVTYEKLFDRVPEQPVKGGIVSLPYDFATLNTLIPHPVYAWLGWVCILNPDETTFETLKPLIAESYEYAQEKPQNDKSIRIQEGLYAF